MIPDYRIKVYRKESGSCNLIFDTNTHSRREDIISIKAQQTVSGEVGSAMVEIDNDPPIRVGTPPDSFLVDDVLEIYLGWQETGLQKVFSGKVYEVAKGSKDEEKTVILKARDWACLFLTDKFTASYPEGENAAQIVKDIISDYISTEEIESEIDQLSGEIYKENPNYNTTWTSSTGTVNDTGSIIHVGQRHHQATWSGNKYVDGLNEELNEGWTASGSGIHLDALDENYISCFMRRLPAASLMCTGFYNEHKDWYDYGSNPLSSDDNDSSYIYLANLHSNVGKYDQYYYFADLDYDYIHVQHLYIKYKAKSTGYPSSYGSVMIYYSIDNGSTWKTDSVSRAVYAGSYTWYSTYDFASDIDTVEKINALRVKINFSGNYGSSGETRITCILTYIEGYGYYGSLKSIRYWTFQDIPSGFESATVKKAVLHVYGRNRKAYQYTPATDCMVGFYLWNGSDWGTRRFMTWTTSETSWTEHTYDFKDNFSNGGELNNARLWIISQHALNNGASYVDITYAYLEIELEDIAKYTIWRGYLFFDTSTIPSEAEIIEASIEFYCTGVYQDRSYSIKVQKGVSETYPHRPLQSGDYYKGNYTGECGVLSTPVVGWNTIVLNEDGKNQIKKGTGAVTKFVLRSSQDIDGSAPALNSNEFIAIYAWTGSYHAKLKVTFTATPGVCDLEMSTNIEATSSTRQVDFVGEPLIDCLNKISAITEHDWYVDENKVFRWFKRDVQGGTSVKTLTDIELEDYSLIDPYENLCNRCKVYGCNNKAYPIDEDSAWTESASGWTDDGSCYEEGNPLSISITTSTMRKFGSYSVLVYPPEVSGTHSEQKIRVKRYFGSNFDLTQKQSFKKLNFSVLVLTWNLPSGLSLRKNKFDVDLIDSSGNRVRIDAGSKAPFWLTVIPYGVTRSTVEFIDVELPVGPEIEEWVKQGTNFNWEEVAGVSFRFEFFTANDTTPCIVWCYIDRLHFTEGRWFGEYEDSASIEKYGIKFKEIFDDIVFSDTAAARKAKAFVEKFKEPIATVEDVVAEYEGQENLNPGDIVTINITEVSSPTKYRIDTITHELTEDFEYKVKLLLSIDPITWEGKIQDLSDRIRRLEQRFKRKKAPEPTEVD